MIPIQRSTPAQVWTSDTLRDYLHSYYQELHSLPADRVRVWWVDFSDYLPFVLICTHGNLPAEVGENFSAGTILVLCATVFQFNSELMIRSLVGQCPDCGAVRVYAGLERDDHT